MMSYPMRAEDLHDGDDGMDVEQDELEGDGPEDDGSRSSSENKDGVFSNVPRKKHRITLGRGAACVICRNRKLKCSGERPCRNCVKAEAECRYEEVQKRKPKAALMEDRVAELEAFLGLAPNEPISNVKHRVSFGEPFDFSKSSNSISPPIKLSPSSHTSSFSGSSKQAPPLSLHSYRDLPSSQPALNAHHSSEVPPHSSLEMALVQLVLPHTPHLMIPLHPQRFIAQLSLSSGDPGRSHPALLYILFAEAVNILEKRVPAPQPPRPPISIFPQLLTPPMPSPPDCTNLLPIVQGMGPVYLERARKELDNGIRNVDRPFDLVRASIGIARYLYAMGRFIEGWNIPVSRLLISCGLHRMSGAFVAPDGDGVHHDSMDSTGNSVASGEIHIDTITNANANAKTDPYLPLPYPPAHQYINTSTYMTGPDGRKYPITRMRPVIIPPPRDEIELAERVMTFWAAKMQDWEAGCGWGWSLSMADEECTTEWGWGWGSVEVKAPEREHYRFGIRDLHDPTSIAHSMPFPDSTYTLALKSLALLHRSSHLFDLPVASHFTHHGNTPRPPTHIPPLAAIQEVETAIRLFKQSIPPIFSIVQPAPVPVPQSQQCPSQFDGRHDFGSMAKLDSAQAQSQHHTGTGTTANDAKVPTESYDGQSDPWWTMLHFNLLTAEMLLWKEKAHQVAGTYETAVRCARAMVELVVRIRPENWVHVDMIVALDLSLASRFLFKESDRLRSAKQLTGAQMAEQDAEILRQALVGEYSRWLPMASLHGLIVQRVREGWSEKEGEYERV